MEGTWYCSIVGDGLCVYCVAGRFNVSEDLRTFDDYDRYYSTFHLKNHPNPISIVKTRINVIINGYNSIIMQVDGHEIFPRFAPSQPI